MSTEPATNTTDVRALAAAVRDGELTPVRREALIDLLHTLNGAVRLAPRARENYPDNDASAAMSYLIATWEPVKHAYAELAATGRPSGEEAAA